MQVVYGLKEDCSLKRLFSCKTQVNLMLNTSLYDVGKEGTLNITILCQFTLKYILDPNCTNHTLLLTKQTNKLFLRSLMKIYVKYKLTYYCSTIRKLSNCLQYQLHFLIIFCFIYQTLTFRHKWSLVILIKCAHLFL